MTRSLFFVVLIITLEASANCEAWFNALDIKLNQKNCLSLCTSAQVDMSTFSCPSQCDILCKVAKNNSKSVLGSAYPGLNESEKKLVANYPIEALKAAKSKFEAEALADQTTREGSIDGENDAARHFFWAALLSREIGVELATEFLDAHEKDPNQKADSRAMDLANNREGLLAYGRLSKKNNFTETQLVDEFKKRFNEKSLSILKPKIKGEL